MKHFLVVVDLQRDFVSGALGSEEARAILPYAAELIRNFEGEIFVTMDTHEENYLETSEGRKLPVEHCIRGREGWELEEIIREALYTQGGYSAVEKPTFGSVALPQILGRAAGGEEFDVTLIGVCTDICVVSNALLLKAFFPEISIKVDARACAGVTPESHAAALSTMQMCQIEILS